MKKIKRTVVKFGGTNLSTGERVKKAAKMVASSGFPEVVVVVSAMGKTTDMLIENMSHVDNISDRDYADIVSMGERISARLFCSALRSLNVEAVYVDPDQESWPIITDSNFVNARPDFMETKKLVRKKLEPLLGKVIPVICGFLGRDAQGNITTLGRGGSDITALLVANCIEADEIILVKETGGILTADPNIIPNAKIIDKLDIHEMFALASGGAKVINSEALKYKLTNQKLRITSFLKKFASKGGTEIVGTFNPDSADLSQHKGLTAITVICEIDANNLSKLFSILHERHIHGVSTGKKSVTIFTHIKNVKETLSRLHDLDNVQAISHQKDVAMVEITHPEFVDSPGWVAKITSALASKKINIIEITTSKATISIFIREQKIREAKKALVEIIET